jgi:hypothetical protein
VIENIAAYVIGFFLRRYPALVNIIVAGFAARCPHPEDRQLIVNGETSWCTRCGALVEVAAYDDDFNAIKKWTVPRA